MKTRRGIVLVLVSGTVVLLLALAMGLLFASRAFSGSAASALRDSCAGLAAASGCDYAAARLLEDAYPRFSVDPAQRGDDWAYRDGRFSASWSVR